MRIGITELALIIIVAMALIRPDKLKEYSRKLGEALKTVKEEGEKTRTELIDPIKDDIAEIKEPIDELTQPVKDIKSTIQDIGLR